jgi:hypothetical protein
MKRFRGILDVVGFCILRLFTRVSEPGAHAHGVVEYWSNGVMQKQRKNYISSLLPILQYSNTPILQKLSFMEI